MLHRSPSECITYYCFEQYSSIHFTAGCTQTSFRQFIQIQKVTSYLVCWMALVVAPRACALCSHNTDSNLLAFDFNYTLTAANHHDAIMNFSFEREMNMQMPRCLPWSLPAINWTAIKTMISVREKKNQYSLIIMRRCNWT